MKKIGLVGGLGPASTVDYYWGLINKYREEHGEDEYPEILIDSVNMHDVIQLFAEKDYKKIGDILSGSIANLQAGGAKIAAITSNTPHLAWKEMDESEIPVLSITKAAVEAAVSCGYKKVLVMGTLFTMESGLYENAMKESGITPIVPNDEDKKVIGNCIYPNLENGIVIPEDREKLLEIAEKYIKQECADAVLLGCTELPLAIKKGDVSVPVLDTTQIHIEAIYENAKE